MISSGIARQGNLRYNEEQLRAREDPLNIYKDRFYERKNAERAMHIRNACAILWRHDEQKLFICIIVIIWLDTCIYSRSSFRT